jgi:hypothetical protein
MSFKPSKKATLGEDGDGEVIRDNNIPQVQLTEVGETLRHLEGEPDDHESALADDHAILEEEARDIITEMLNSHEGQVG